MSGYVSRGGSDRNSGWVGQGLNGFSREIALRGGRSVQGQCRDSERIAAEFERAWVRFQVSRQRDVMMRHVAFSVRAMNFNLRRSATDRRRAAEENSREYARHLLGGTRLR